MTIAPDMTGAFQALAAQRDGAVALPQGADELDTATLLALASAAPSGGASLAAQELEGYVRSPQGAVGGATNAVTASQHPDIRSSTRIP